MPLCMNPGDLSTGYTISVERPYGSPMEVPRNLYRFVYEEDIVAYICTYILYREKIKRDRLSQVGYTMFCKES